MCGGVFHTRCPVREGRARVCVGGSSILGALYARGGLGCVWWGCSILGALYVRGGLGLGCVWGGCSILGALYLYAWCTAVQACIWLLSSLHLAAVQACTWLLSKPASGCCPSLHLAAGRYTLYPVPPLYLPAQCLPVWRGAGMYEGTDESTCHCCRRPLAF